MARTLADLTLKLSQDLSDLEAGCTRKMDEVEEARDGALIEIGPAKKAIEDRNRSLAKAKATQLKDVQKANEILDKEIRSAEEKRARALTLAERKNRHGRAKAFRDLQATLKQAKAKWKLALENLRRRPLAEHRTIRKAADKAYEGTVEAARETYNNKAEEARLTNQLTISDILTDQRLAVEKAHRNAERITTSATVAYERALAQGEARMWSELASHPQARQIQEDYNQRLFEIRKDCEGKKDALFKQFSQDSKKVKQ